MNATGIVAALSKSNSGGMRITPLPRVATWVARAAGATEDEILSAIVVCFATCGIGPTVEALEETLLALDALREKTEENTGERGNVAA